MPSGNKPLPEPMLTHFHDVTRPPCNNVILSGRKFALECEIVSKSTLVRVIAWCCTCVKSFSGLIMIMLMHMTATSR